ncbi:heme ABC transporter ATP-binding protein [Pseudobdellovibrio exovorus]|uniref:ABC transporter domain-containing protein n=1 Tax=Pseudobdellovibrio exovorus JSS TaxID=1184267 RepID=M4V973_9BACT|nr:heme ABC transporter ATP-binding protein [Pseudobdellovibrio exovorus]AGH95952.1 hypothetical protein A11Q_1736 [Pseudobdellovibrio exovorus JSS]
MANPLLQVRNLSFEISDKSSKRKLVDQLEFAVSSQELLVILGRNGAGKSTLMKLITKQLKPNEGSVQVFGKELGEHHPRELAKRRAVLTQFTSLTFDYSVLDVVLLGRTPHSEFNSIKQFDRELALHCLELVDLQDFANRGYLSLSGGEQQRVHMARVLAQLGDSQEERLLLLDEPTSSLDLYHQHQLLELLRKIKKNNVGILAILHDLNLAARYADRLLIMKQGKTLALGTPQDVFTSENIAEAFNYHANVLQDPTRGCPYLI